MYTILFSLLFIFVEWLYYKFIKHTSSFISFVKSLFNTEIILFVIGIPISSILSETPFYIAETIIIFIIIFICLLKEEWLHEVHCYEFKFDDYKSFSNYINTKLKEQNFNSRNLCDNITVYEKDTLPVKVIVNCYFNQIDIKQFKILFNEIIHYLNDNYYLNGSLNGLTSCIIINTNKVSDINKIVTKTSDLAYVKRSTKKILFSTVVDYTEKKIYICDDDMFLDKSQKKMIVKIFKLMNLDVKNKND